MDDFTEQRMVQSRGPTIEFEGRLIASDSFNLKSGHPSKMTMEIWETRGGALIALTRSESLDDDPQWRPITIATVVEPGPDESERRFAIMDAFDWEDRARSMVRKQLKWRLVHHVT